MVSVIAIALVETLTKHMFKSYLDEMDQVEIGGAPSWYMVQIESDLCTFAHKQGSFDSIDIAKDNAKFKMSKKIDQIVEITIYDNISHIKDEKSKKIVDNFKTDSNLPVFVNKNLSYSMIAYEDEVDTTFVRACIPRDIIFTYQKDRLAIIEKAVLDSKSRGAFDELDSAFGEESDDRFKF